MAWGVGYVVRGKPFKHDDKVVRLMQCDNQCSIRMFCERLPVAHPLCTDMTVYMGTILVPSA